MAAVFLCVEGGAQRAPSAAVVCRLERVGVRPRAHTPKFGWSQRREYREYSNSLSSFSRCVEKYARGVEHGSGNLVPECHCTMAMLGSPVPGLARLLLALVALATPTSSLHGAWRPRAATASRPTRRLANIKSQLIIARLEGARDSSEGGTPGWSGLRGDPGLIDITVVPDGFRTGFVSIVGSPNVGKSTLMNALVDDDLSIATNKAQTTRQRITGVVTGQDFQIVYCDSESARRYHRSRRSRHRSRRRVRRSF